MNIDLILLKPVLQLGKKGDVVHVARGFARNFLIPQGFAKAATEGEVRDVQEQKASQEKKLMARLANLQDMKKVLQGKRIRVASLTTEAGRLYAAVSKEEIANALYQTYGFEVPEDAIKMDAVKTVGLHPFSIHLKNVGDIAMKVRVASAARE